MAPISNKSANLQLKFYTQFWLALRFSSSPSWPPRVKDSSFYFPFALLSHKTQSHHTADPPIYIFCHSGNRKRHTNLKQQFKLMDCKFDSQNFRLLKSISYKNMCFLFGNTYVRIFMWESWYSDVIFQCTPFRSGHLTEHKMASHFGLKLKGRLHYWDKLRTCSSHKAKLSGCIRQQILGDGHVAGIKYWEDLHLTKLTININIIIIYNASEHPEEVCGHRTGKTELLLGLQTGLTRTRV